jgi:hypothetical protein
MFLDKLPNAVTAFLVTVIPYTPVDIIIYLLMFLLVYWLSPFGLGKKTVHQCRFNKLQNKQESSIWTSMKNSYYYYFLVAVLVNYTTVIRATVAAGAALAPV